MENFIYTKIIWNIKIISKNVKWATESKNRPQKIITDSTGHEIILHIYYSSYWLLRKVYREKSLEEFSTANVFPYNLRMWTYF
jgi:hypothetical protein